MLNVGGHYEKRRNAIHMRGIRVALDGVESFVRSLMDVTGMTVGVFGYL